MEWHTVEVVVLAPVLALVQPPLSDCPGDAAHDQFPGGDGSSHRLLCTHPLGRGFVLESNLF